MSCSRRWRVTDGEDFFFFGGEELVDLFQVFVVELLGLGFGILLHVLGHTLLDGFLQAVDGVAAGVAHRHLCSFGLGFRLLYKQLAALFCQRGNTDADYFTVVFGHYAEFGVDDCFLNFLEHGFFPGSDGYGARIGHRYVRNVGNGRLRTVVIHAYAVEKTCRSLAGTDVRKSVIKILDCELHRVFGVLEIFFYFHMVCFYLCLLRGIPERIKSASRREAALMKDAAPVRERDDQRAVTRVPTGAPSRAFFRLPGMSMLKT